MVEAGAQVLIAGSAVYKGEPVREMRKIIESGRQVVGEIRQTARTGRDLDNPL
jgi:hypothetical protein